MRECKLTDKQKMFALEYISTLNATESYKKAYRVNNDSTARTNSSRLLVNANVKRFIQEKLQEMESKKIAKAEEVLTFLTSSLRGEIEEEVAMSETDSEGGLSPVIIKKQISAKDRIKCAELLGKRYALFTERHEIEGNGTVQIICDIPEEE